MTRKGEIFASFLENFGPKFLEAATLRQKTLRCSHLASVGTLDQGFLNLGSRTSWDLRSKFRDSRRFI